MKKISSHHDHLLSRKKMSITPGAGAQKPLKTIRQTKKQTKKKASILSAEDARQDTSCILLLHNIRSVFNVGALFRTADAVGVTKIILSGYSPTPRDRFGRERSDLAKCALGAEKSIDWEYVATPTSLLRTYRDQGYTLIGVEQDARSLDYKKVPPLKRSVIILGTETTGMTKSLREVCDMLVEIPMKGIKESLNVSVAGGIVLYRLLDR